MTDGLDILTRLVDYHDHIAPPTVPVADDVRRGRRRVRRNRGIVTGGVALGVAGVVLTASLITGGDRDTHPEPAIPSPTATATDTATVSTPPIPPAPGWAGALRTDQASLPVLSERTGRVDGADAAVGWIDIRRVYAYARPEYRLVLQDPPPLASSLDPTRRVMEHGVVVDSDGDRVADCRIGISTDAPTPGDFRVWVTDLRAGTTVEQIGPPYGIPIDFFHPAEREDPTVESMSRTISLFFLGATPGARCELGTGASFYAYAVVMDRGRDPEWDFAPDAAWLRIS